MTKLAFIGAGNMNGAILSGLVNKGFNPQNIIVANPSAPKREALSEQYGVLHTSSNIEAVAFADYVILGVKPHLIAQVCQEIATETAIENKCFVSVAAGCTIEQIQQALNGQYPVIRVMPNTPSQLGYGVSGLYASIDVSENQKQQTAEFMKSVGIIKWLNTEAEIDHIIAVSGSAPAYFFLFMEAMQNKAIALGFTEQESRELVQQTALGAAQMVINNDLPISQLRKNVTSKGGTTQAALTTLIDGGLEQLVTNAMDSALHRAKEMAENSN
ncbi:pyrroline-5-carboxylate reductase [Thalassotalea piscium]|uniref:Pyrroline-5-carboxylate reductase n=1 Tax=Thalassotalea piscium TaxID=1230533 RepID=A0A7X0NJL7_9GAMM|nr:pyrroline-5-carboxylate reductase [Thalassotalea piscium]MBB6544521.1 pyrroline-5-carboxylate reductase [Thalassotalea piscium]